MDDELRRRLAFVAPERRITVERRLAVLLEYDRLAPATAEDTASAARELGLTRQGFERVVQIWRRDRDPSSLEGVGGNWGPDPRRQLGDEAFIRRAFAALPPGVALERAAEAIRLEADCLGVPLRGNATLRRLLTTLRAERDAAASEARVVVDHVALEMPVESADGRGPFMPIATLVADLRRGALLSVVLDLYTPTPGAVAAALGAAASRGAFAAARSPTPVGYDAGANDGWDRLARSLEAAGVAPPPRRTGVVRGGRWSGGLASPTLLGVPTRPGIINKRMEGRRFRLRARGDAALTLERAQALIDERLSLEPTARAVPFSRDPTLLAWLPA